MLRNVLMLGAAIATVGADTGRDLLFSNPQASLPDVVLSESVVYVNEGGSFMYTVKLSHKPGVRQDKTVDLANDEVRIYLTSSQEVYQQGTGTAAGSETFTSMLGHRTQLQIDTNVVKCESALNSVMGAYTTADCFDALYDPATPAGIMAGICRDADDNDGTYSSETTKTTCIAAGKVWEPASMHYELPLPVQLAEPHPGLAPNHGRHVRQGMPAVHAPQVLPAGHGGRDHRVLQQRQRRDGRHGDARL
jgi:hypothetical protein